jgi:hypothetical protein
MTSPETIAVRLPWPTLAVSSGVAGFILIRGLAVPGYVPSLLTVRLVELTLAAGAAYLLDDAAARLTDVAPRPLWRRRALSLVSGLAVITAAWGVVLLHLPGARVALLRSLTIEVVVLVVLALAVSAVLARRGETEPGRLAAATVPLVGLAMLVSGGFLGFDAYLTPADHSGKLMVWLGVGVLALVSLALASRDTSARSLVNPSGR